MEGQSEDANRRTDVQVALEGQLHPDRSCTRPIVYLQSLFGLKPKTRTS